MRIVWCSECWFAIAQTPYTAPKPWKPIKSAFWSPENAILDPSQSGPKSQLKCLNWTFLGHFHGHVWYFHWLLGPFSGGSKMAFFQTLKCTCFRWSHCTDCSPEFSWDAVASFYNLWHRKQRTMMHTIRQNIVTELIRKQFLDRPRTTLGCSPPLD